MRILSAILLALTPSSATAQPNPAWRDDAPLADIAAPDADHAWAVGGHGAIWATTDAGQTWLEQPSSTAAQLTSVSFIDTSTGWAAGGHYRPHLDATAAVLLHTTDGGANWTLLPTAGLPALAHIHFSDTRRGWAVAAPSALYPAGIFTTDDGGDNWLPLPAPAGDRWIAADFRDPLSGLLLGANEGMNTLGIVNRRALAAIDAPHEVTGRLSTARLADDRCWLAGRSGAVVSCDATGRNPQVAASLPPEAAQFDWRSIATAGPHVWLAGAPGSHILHSPDAGHSWQLQPTGQTLPLARIKFSDADHGWAVGPLGTILRTADGGSTWQIARGASRRAAVLVIAASAAEVPWEAVAHLSDEGYRCAIHTMFTDDDTPHIARLRAAALAAGAVAVESSWRFPRRDPALRIGADAHQAAWDAAYDGQAATLLNQDLVNAIRAWRPNIILTCMPSPGGNDLNSLLAASVSNAAREVGPWSVDRLYGWAPAGARGSIELAGSQFAPGLGRALAEVAADAAAILGDEAPRPALTSFALLSDNPRANATVAEGTFGLTLTPDSDARRPLVRAVENPAGALRAAQRSRNLEAILANQHDQGLGEAQLLAQINTLTADLDPARAAAVLRRLADAYHRSGRWSLAAEAHELLAERYPADPLAAASLVWLVQYWSSGEAAWRVDRHAAIHLVSPPSQVQPAAATENSGAVEPAVAFDRPPDNARLEHAARALARLQALDAAVAAEPDIGFPLAARRRASGQQNEADSFFAILRRTRAGDPWAACADVERWLAAPATEPSKPVWHIRRAATRPRLDGDLSDEVWKNAEPAELKSPLHDDSAWPAVALLAYDDEFLYLAASCRRAPGADYSSKQQGPRPRDANLSTSDAITFTFDIDRDWVTAYRLSIDHQGRPAEQCWGDASWNPTWYIAPAPGAASGADAWIVEAAIPLSELVPHPPKPGDCWSAGATRLAPAAGFQSWSAPASPRGLLHGMGILCFQ